MINSNQLLSFAEENPKFMIARLILVVLLGIPFSGKSQEWWDLKYHEGNDAAKYNNDPSFKGNLHRETDLRAKEKSQPEFKVLTKAARKRKVILDREKADAFAILDLELSTNGGKLVDCSQCAGRGILICASCDGEGSTTCSSCLGVARADCRICSGTGVLNEQTCTACDGSGKKKCQFCGGLRPGCGQCAGLGYSNCQSCRGAAKMIINSNGIDTLVVSKRITPIESTQAKKVKNR